MDTDFRSLSTRPEEPVDFGLEARHHLAQAQAAKCRLDQAEAEAQGRVEAAEKAANPRRWAVRRLAAILAAAAQAEIAQQEAEQMGQRIARRPR